MLSASSNSAILSEWQTRILVLLRGMIKKAPSLSSRITDCNHAFASAIPLAESMFIQVSVDYCPHNVNNQNQLFSTALSPGKQPTEKEKYQTEYAHPQHHGTKMKRAQLLVKTRKQINVVPANQRTNYAHHNHSDHGLAAL